jgi:predicted CopG family antitoxin
MRPSEFLEEYYEKKKKEAQLPQQETSDDVEKYTEEQVSRAIALYLEGLSFSEIIESLKQTKKD